jgi:pre-mRNA-processing factor SLU7
MDPVSGKPLKSGAIVKEEWKKRKEIEEARKAGFMPAELDEEGNEINPHIPEYIAKAPWYVDTGAPSLRHQKSISHGIGGKGGISLQQEEELLLSTKGVKVVSATKYLPGACSNCGASTHKTKDCVERPRKIGAKWTKSGICPDELVGAGASSKNLQNHDFDTKRDRWKGFDPNSYKDVIDRYKVIDEKRKKIKETDTSNVDTKEKSIVRTLRVREDTAKYLYNLDPNSAYYDPKTRSMRENPLSDPTKTQYIGDNFVRATGESQKVNELTLFSWEMSQSRTDDSKNTLHLQANPSETEKTWKKYIEDKSKQDEEHQNLLLERYGPQDQYRNSE